MEPRLRRALRGEVRFDRFTRGLYATDASIYEVEPLAVAFPRSSDDVVRAIEIAGEHGVPVIPRGAGTSMSGQSIGRGLVLDTSRHLDAVLDFDPAGRRIVVQPGLVLDRLNAYLRPHGLHFPIDVATSSRATIGGMAGNNSAGARSIRFGHTVEHVTGVEAVLANGRRAWFGPDPGRPSASRGTRWAPAAGPPPAALGRALHALYQQEADELARRIPAVPRYVAGYALHRLGRPEPRLSDILIGSEGTLAFFTALELDLQPIPRARTLAVCRFRGVRDALASVPAIVSLRPTAVELVDRTLLDLAGRNPSFRGTLARLLGSAPSGRRGGPGAVLLVEFSADDAGEARNGLDALETTLAGGALAGLVRAELPEQQREIWALRKAGLNIAMSMPDPRKPIAFIEDCVVPLSRLPEWHDRLTRVLERHETRAIWYAHASVGCLHVRPALDLSRADDVWRLRAIAEEAFAVARELGGTHSGEHGDGMIRSEFLEPMLGPRLVAAFEEIKRRFDPDDRLNPGKIVRPPRMDDRTLFRHGPDGAAAPPAALDWSTSGGFAGAVGLCNSNGACRAFEPGVMCPSFRATADERHSTRGRAMALRMALTGRLGADPWDSPDLREAMDLCIGCKGCRRECPTGVDMARMKIEFLHRYRSRHPLTARERLLAYLPRYAPWVRRMHRLLNARERSPALARLAERTLGFAADRALPRWAPEAYEERGRERDSGARRGEVLLFVDTFTRYFEPEKADAAGRVLRAAGYAVVPAAVVGASLGQSSVRSRPLCCGRTFLNVGLVAEARVEQGRVLAAVEPWVKRGTRVVGLEPSCLLTLRDELPALVPGDRAAALAEHAVLLPELLVADGALDDLPLRPLPTTRLRVHGHCHEKAFGLAEQTVQALEAIPEASVDLIAAGCCGMAGSFGYEVEHAALSRRIAGLELLPALGRSAPGDWVVANGTSCRHQIADLAGVKALHAVEVLDAALGGSAPTGRPATPRPAVRSSGRTRSDL